MKFEHRQFHLKEADYRRLHGRCDLRGHRDLHGHYGRHDGHGVYHSFHVRLCHHHHDHDDSLRLHGGGDLHLHHSDDHNGHCGGHLSLIHI